MRRLLDLAACGVGYLIGSIPFGLWLGRNRGVDVRDHGSGATGATNVMRILGPAAGATTFALDTAKGAVAVGVARAMGASSSGQVAAGVSAMVGHSWPVFAHFRGGKSVATAFGGLLVFSPAAGAAAVVGGTTALLTTRIVSIGSLVATSSAAGYAAVEYKRSGDGTALAFMAMALPLIFIRHQENLKRIIRGEESRLSWRRSSR